MTLPVESRNAVLANSNWRFPSRRYMMDGECDVLIALVNSVEPKTMIEFGVNEGLTARAVLQAVEGIKRYIGIDVLPGYEFEIPAQSVEKPQEPGCLVNDPRFELMLRPRGTQDIFAAMLPIADVVFIDGDHGRKSVAWDAALATQIVRKGGMIIFHDYWNGSVQVTEVLDKLYAEGRDLRVVEGTWLVFERR
jgi:predicted O-methyltransferase YrrM